MFSIRPVHRLSEQTTSSPRAIRASQRWEPMKPAPPVTRVRTLAPCWIHSDTETLQDIGPRTPRPRTVQPADTHLSWAKALRASSRRGLRTTLQSTDG